MDSTHTETTEIKQTEEVAAVAAVKAVTSTTISHTTSGREPWMDVELEVRLHFGGREMLVAEAFDIAPGTVLELDRDVTDPVDLLVGDRIVARGEVVVVGGNFALHVSEVLEPEPRLESVRCLL